jgi:hypothetical protein
MHNKLWLSWLLAPTAKKERRIKSGGDYGNMQVRNSLCLEKIKK